MFWWTVKPFVVLLVILAIVVVVGSQISGCEQRKILQPKFGPGDKVVSKLAEEVGMIIKVHGCNEETCYYDVRFVGKQPRTETSFLGRDDPMSISIPLVTVEWVREYELLEYKAK